VDPDELRARRVANHRLGAATFSNAPAVVAALCAVQSQDFAGAMWAVAQRTENVTKSDVTDAFTRGEIIRTHLLRPTWHFVAASDLEWMVRLTGPRLERALSSNYRRLGLDDAEFARTDAILADALTGGIQLTRPELMETLRRAGIDIDDPLRFTHISQHAEAVGLICSGAMRGRSHTCALVRDRIPAGLSTYPSDPAQELAQRYFLCHGPATVRDFSWWSGLTLRECQLAIEASGSALSSTSSAGVTWWSSALEQPAPALDDDVRLLANYDEYLVGYADRSALFDAKHTAQLDSRRNPLFTHTVMAGGRIIGTWKRVSHRGRVTARVELFERASRRTRDSVELAVQRYADWAAS